ncbi:hypothetical protein MMC06_005751 [Schaereria dolodes]|nr:hypothetical protein [Schaereria dolodes]
MPHSCRPQDEDATRRPYMNSPIHSYPRPRSRQRWPPPPSVEDEEISLSHEHPPMRRDVPNDLVEMRGTIDQNPIILEVEKTPWSLRGDRPPENSDGDGTSLNSESSDESVQPRTPTGPTNLNPDRRYVYIPQEGIEIPITYDEQKPPIQSNLGRRRAASYETRKTQEPPILESRPLSRGKVEIPPINTQRQPSPYSYSSSSGKSRFSDEHHLSPGMLSPEARTFHSPQKNTRSNKEVNLPQRFDRRYSGFSDAQSARPMVNRHFSAAAFPGGPLSAGPVRDVRPRSDFATDDSDSSSDEPGEKNRWHRKPRRRQSVARPEHSRQGSAIMYNEANKQPKTITKADPRVKSTPLQSLTSPKERSSSQSSLAKGLPFASLGTFTKFQANPQYPGRTSPRASPVASPSTSPYSSPPRSPLVEANKGSHEIAGGNRKFRLGSKSSSRPSSPSLSGKHSSKSAGLDLPFEYLVGELPKAAPRSRQSSPLPSPTPDRPGHNPELRNEYQIPQAAHNFRSSNQFADQTIQPRSRESSASSVRAQPPTARVVGSESQRRTFSTSDTNMHLPADIYYPRKSSEMPRSPSSKAPPRPVTPDACPMQPPSLPRCPRPNFTTGHNDWYTLAGCPTFDICPTCLGAVKETGYGASFVPSPARPYGYETRCDFGIPWVRMAWLLTLKRDMPHIKLLYTMAEILAREPPCPGKIGAVRYWYRLYDPDTRKPISNFDACPHCVRSLETIFPGLRSVFQPAQLSNASQLRTCDLRGDSNRFAGYVDLLEEIADQADQYRRPPNMYRFLQHVRQKVETRECTRDDMVIGQPWHFIPQMPEFTVCEECFDEVVWPAINAGSPVAGQCNRTLQLLPPTPMGVSCQMYSPRMREVFRDACRRNDFQSLRATVMHRFMVERDLQAKHVEAKMYGYENRREEITRLVDEWKRWE